MTQQEITLLNLGSSLDDLANLDPRGYGVCKLLYKASREYTGLPLCVNAAQKLVEAVKKGDKVLVLSGKDKGKEGKIIAVSPKEGKLIVEGVNIVSKHVKPRRAGQEGGIVKTEGALYACKVQLVCPKCGKATRIAHKIAEDGKKKRSCKKCGEAI